MEPKVSVILATYRRNESLKKALCSLLEQTYKSLEIILVDDNDEESFNKKVKKLVDGLDSNVDIKLVVNHPNLGSAKARNVGISMASGEFITFLDDDDIYLPEKIEYQVKYMIQSKADYCITDLELFNVYDRLIEKRVRNYIRNYDSKSLMKYHLMYHMTGTDTMMFRKEYLDEIGGFDAIDVGDEFYLMKKAIEGGGCFGYLNRCDIKAYIHTNDNGLSSGQSKIDGENQLYKFKKNYFDDMDKKTIRYIRMRHYAVLAFAYLRMKNIISFFKYAFRAFFSGPLECLKLISELK